MDGVWTELVIILLLLIANGIFAGSETAVVAARKVRLQLRAEEGDQRARAALQLARNPAQFLSTVQFGITLIGVLAGAYGGTTLADSLAAVLVTVPQLAPYAQGLALGIVVASITFFSLIIGELVPKNIAIRSPEAIASWVAKPMQWLSRLGGPLVTALTGVTSLILRLLGLGGSVAANLTEDEIRAVITEGVASGAIEEAKSTVVHRVFSLGDLRAVAFMTPRIDIEWIDVDATPQELRDFIASHNFTQFIVSRNELDNVVGTVRAADLLPVVLRGETIDLKTMTREPLYVPGSMRGFPLLEAFRASHTHVALVMDEFGAVEGLVTVTDLLEALVGDLPGDPSEAGGPFTERGDGSWLIDGSASMDVATTKFQLAALPNEEAGAYHTVGGFVMARLGRVPECADTFTWGGVRFEVMDMDGRRVDKVMVTPAPETSADSTAAVATLGSP